MACARAVFGSPKGLPNLLAKQVQHLIVTREFEMARAMLRDLSYRHRSEFEDFMKEFGDQIPDDVKEDLGWVE